ncbi:Mss4-like protein [Xylariaceae sp. FL0255]|nr:Mss4-like protein [Xylariaceae sp. FL0255]
MPTGACLCGEIKISFTGEPVFRATCYCADCRKMPHMQTYQIPKSAFSITQGEPKVYTKVSDHDRVGSKDPLFDNTLLTWLKEISSHFCGTCGTVLFRTGGVPINKDNIGLRAGVLDDQSLLHKAPDIEVFAEKRPPWMAKIDGAVQLDANYEPIQGDLASAVGR